MRKKDKLYTVNKWNQPAFMPERKNLFSGLQLNPSQMQQLKLQNMSTNAGGVPSLGVNMAPQLSTSSLGLGSLGKGGTGSLAAANPAEFFGLGDAAGATGKGGIGGLFSGLGDKIGGVMGGGKLAGSPIGGLVSGLGSAVGNIGGGLIGGGLQSGAGSAISNIGGAVGSAVGTVNPVLGAAVSAASGIVGGLANRAFGSKLNEENIAKVEGDIANLNQAGSALAGAGTAADVVSNWSSFFVGWRVISTSVNHVLSLACDLVSFIGRDVFYGISYVSWCFIVD